MSLYVDVIALDQPLFSGKARFVSVPGEEGVLGIYPGHMPLFTRLQLGPVRVQRTDDVWVDVVIAGGILEVTNEAVVVLADQARRTAIEDQAAIESAYQAAVHLLSTKDSAQEDYAALEKELAMLKAQLVLLRRRHHR